MVSLGGMEIIEGGFTPDITPGARVVAMHFLTLRDLTSQSKVRSGDRSILYAISGTERVMSTLRPFWYERCPSIK
mgnify:CR=1 FL=1